MERKKSPMAKRKGNEGGLDKWFKEEWVDVSRKKNGKHPPCGRKKADGSRYPACRPKAKAAKLTDAQKKSAAKRKSSSGLPVAGKPRHIKWPKGGRK